MNFNSDLVFKGKNKMYNGNNFRCYIFITNNIRLNKIELRKILINKYNVNVIKINSIIYPTKYKFFYFRGGRKIKKVVRKRKKKFFVILKSNQYIRVN